MIFLLIAFGVFVGYVVYRDWFVMHRQNYLNDKVIEITQDILDRVFSQNWIDYINGKGLQRSGEVKYAEQVKAAVEEEQRRQVEEGEVPIQLNK